MTTAYRQRSDQSAPSKDEHEAFTRDWQDSRDGLRKFHLASTTEYNYGIKLRQHNEPDDLSGLSLSRRRRRTVTTLDLYDIIRYQSASLGGASTYLDVKTATPAGDEQLGPDGAPGPLAKKWQEAANTAKSVLMEQITDTDLGFPRVKRKVIRQAIAARAGACRLDVVPGGQNGAVIVPTMIDWRNLGWDLRYSHFNEWGCPWLDETIRIPIEEAKRRVKSDGWRKKAVDALRPDDYDIINGTGGTTWDVAEPKVDRAAWKKHRNHVTLVVRWIKDADETPEPEAPEQLEPRDWYMACPTCGYSEYDLSKSVDYDGSMLPPFAPCPRCGLTAEGEPAGTMERMEVAPQMGKEVEPKERHRRVIFAPFCPTAGLLKDGPWPKGLEGFPYWMFVPDPFPLEPVGNSTTYLNQDLQSLKNQSMRSAAEQMERNHDLTIVLETEYTDGNGEPYDWSGNGPSGYRAMTNNPEALNGAKHFQGSGLNPAFMPWITVLDANLTQHRGTGQYSMTPAQIKGTTAETAARVQETGDVPVDEVLRILREDFEQLLQRWLELIGGNWTIDRWTEVAGPSGETAWRLFRPSALPPLRLKVHSGPDLNLVDIDRIRAVKEMQGLPPVAMRLVASALNLPSELVEQLIKETMAPPAGPMGPAGAPGLPMPGAGVGLPMSGGAEPMPVPA